MASIKKRPDGHWRARYRDADGKEHARHFARKVDGQRWLDEQTASIVTGQYVHPTAGKIRFKDYAEEWRRIQEHRPSTAAWTETNLRRHVYPVLGNRPIGEIRPSHIQAWVAGMNLADSTRSTVHGVVSGIFRAAVRDRRIMANPCDGTKLPKGQRKLVVPLPTEHVTALINGAPEIARAILAGAAGTGMRQGEILGLEVRHVDFLRRVLTVEQQLVTTVGIPPYLGPPKTDASVREIPLPSVVADELARHLARFPAADVEILDRTGARPLTRTARMLFTTEARKPWSRSYFGHYAWSTARDAAGLTDVGMHDLRHYYASLLIRHNESVKVVQKRLGHATAAETLDTYSHLWPDADDRTREAVDAALTIPAADSLRTAT